MGANREQKVKRAPLYSRSRRPPTATAAQPATPAHPEAARPPGPGARLLAFAGRHERRLWAGLLAALLLAAVLQPTLMPRPYVPTMQDIDEALRKSIAENPLPSAAAKAYETILPSLVRVVGQTNEADDGSDDKDHRGVGSGVVIVDTGIILTNLHVVQGAKRIKVTFADGTESDAEVTGIQAENDLAVLRAKKIPDDLQAATMRSTGDLLPGDHVVAVGFPFGIGPSVSAAWCRASSASSDRPRETRC